MADYPLAPLHRCWPRMTRVGLALTLLAGCQPAERPQRSASDAGVPADDAQAHLVDGVTADADVPPPGVDQPLQLDAAASIHDSGAPAAADSVPAGDSGAPPACSTDQQCSDPVNPLCQAGQCIPCPGGTHSAVFVDEDVPDGTSFSPGQSFSKRWGLKNSGSAGWSAPCGTSFRRISGQALSSSGEASLAADERVASGSKKDWLVPMQAPNTPGTYKSTWRMHQGSSPFGDAVWVQIKVSACATDADCKDPAASRCQPDGSCAPPPCLADSDCTDPSKPFCATSGCVQCTTSSNCTAAAPSCINNSCIDPNACGNGPMPSLGTTVWPVPTQTKLCQGYGVWIDYIECMFHTGIDICAQKGDPVLAVASGKVVHVGYMWLNGTDSGRGPNAIIIEHSPGFYSTYGHNDKALVKVGDCVTAGQQIAEIGNLGYGKLYHLHFEMLDNTSFTGSWSVPFKNACAKYVNPMSYVQP